jgi:3-phenylpropionate/cinnamic acid dioxygenase small subunit
MANNNPSTLMEDEHQIANLLIRWGHARDSGDWETLAACFHDDATIHISWISASAKEFIAGSRAMAAARQPGAHTKHLISGLWIQVKGDHAFSRCHVNLYSRTTINGYQFDTQNWLRFFDLLERRDNIWRIVKRTAVYEKDRMDPVDPRGVPEDFFADMDLSAFPASAKFICYRLLQNGRTPSSDIISVYSDGERTLKQEGEAWLANA